MSESISTTLIFCNRGNAKVKSSDTQGQFVNEVPYGIKVEAGDTISVESVAVSTDGTGADVIEIPNRIANYNYKTNKIQLDCLLYINHNNFYSVVLPCKKSSSGGGGTTQFYTDITLVEEGKYGYFASNGIDINNISKLIPYEQKRTINKQFSGKPFYLGSFSNDPRARIASGTYDDSSLYPTFQVWNFLSKKIIIDVPTGYNSPANLSKTITQSLHQSNVAPNYLPSGNPNQRINTDFPYSVDQSQWDDKLFSISDVTGTSEVIYGIPRTLNNQATNNTTVYNGLLGTTNPYYCYWGSRLLCTGANPEGTTKNNTYLARRFAGGTPKDYAIYSLIDFPTLGFLEKGFTIATNLPYNESTLKKLRGFIHSQKSFDKTIQPEISTNDLFNKENQNRFYTLMYFGRKNDSVFAAGGNQPLPNSVIASNTHFGNVSQRTFFDPDLVNNAFINNESIGLSIATDQSLTIDGIEYDYREVARYFDINVVPVYAEYPPDPLREVNIGIVIQRQATLQTFKAGCDFLVDFSLFNDDNTMCLMANSDTVPSGNVHHLPDLVKYMNVGAPEMTLTFDDQKARFKFQRLYWSNYITNDPTKADANASAGNEVITLNPRERLTYVDGDTVQYRFAQCGIGIEDISVFDFDGNEQKIDWYSDKDIQEKFTQSLLWRLGFRYKNMLNRYGKPSTILQERYYNTSVPTSKVCDFPYPLTSNPRFDTTLVPSIPTYDNGLPAWNLSTTRGQTDINIATEPNDVLATALPKKLATPLWLIESDVIEGINYTIDGRPKNIVCAVNRAYSSSDFVFSFATDYKFTVTNPFVITHIKSNVLTSDLINADVDDETTIIYKVEHIKKLGDNQAVTDEANPYDITI